MEEEGSIANLLQAKEILILRYSVFFRNGLWQNSGGGRESS